MARDCAALASPKGRAVTLTAVRISMKRRMASKTAWKTTAPTITTVSMISVSTERLVSTRSEI